MIRLALIILAATLALPLSAADLPSDELDVRIYRLAYILPDEPQYSALPRVELVWKSGGAPTQLSLIQLLHKTKGPRASIWFVKSSNALIVHDTPARLDEMQAFIDKLDYPPKNTAFLFQGSENYQIRWDGNDGRGSATETFVANTEGGG